MREPTRSRALATLVLAVATGLGGAVLLAPAGYAAPAAPTTTPTPPVETEPPGGAACLPGGPSTGCAPDGSPSAHPRATKQTHSPRPRASQSRSTRPATRSGPAVSSVTPTTTPSPRHSSTAAAEKVEPVADSPRPTAPAATAGPARVAPAASAVAYAQDAAPPATSGVPGWVAPVVTMLLVLLGVVLVVGPARRRAQHR